jgi:hypothetical protein
MMRKIRFRGKDKDGIWWHGQLLDLKSGMYILINVKRDGCSGELCKVDEQSIGQYIGMRDVSGAYIFEGDILETEQGHHVVVGYSEESAAFTLRDIHNSEVFHSIGLVGQMRLVGNIYDNKDLINEVCNDIDG